MLAHPVGMWRLAPFQRRWRCASLTTIHKWIWTNQTLSPKYFADVFLHTPLRVLEVVVVSYLVQFSTNWSENHIWICFSGPWHLKYYSADFKYPVKILFWTWTRMKVTSYIPLGLIEIGISLSLRPWDMSIQITSHGIYFWSFLAMISHNFVVFAMLCNCCY